MDIISIFRYDSKGDIFNEIREDLLNIRVFDFFNNKYHDELEFDTIPEFLRDLI
jgi:hypothetical protein